ncbi:adenine deaminase [Thermodesulfobacteriota bacterium]
MDMTKRIQAARGDIPADLCIVNGRLLNVLTGEILEQAVSIADGVVVGFGEREARRRLDARGCYLVPGLVDPHVHIESSMVCVSEFAKAVLPHGTTTVVADPHEIANVLGTGGIRYMLDSARGQPMGVFFTLPSCVPATEMETSGARLRARDLEPFLDEEMIVGLAEVMNFPGVIHGDLDVLEKIDRARRRAKRVDGHAPGVLGANLDAYITAGVASDHECTGVEEAMEKARKGMHVMIRQGTGAKNLHDLLPAVTEDNHRCFMWCTDDRHPHDILDTGHVDSIVREAIGLGLDPVTAVRLGTINAAEYFGLHDRGAIAPGRRADVLLVPDLAEFRPVQVVSGGMLVARNGRLLPGTSWPQTVSGASSMNVATGGPDFAVPADGKRIRVMELVPGQIVTRQVVEDARVENGRAVPDPERDILKLAVVERHSATGNVGKGFVRGFGIKAGALASSVAHDSHNIIVVGASDDDMRAACEAVVAMEGGLAAVLNGARLAGLALPVGGLMSEMTMVAVRERLDALLEASWSLGCIAEDPFMALSFLALPVIPELKLTDKGLVHVPSFSVVPLFA